MDLMNVSRILALGGSIYRILRVWRSLGGSICRMLRVWKALGGSVCGIFFAWSSLGEAASNQAKVPGGSAREGPYACGGEESGEALGGSIYRILRVWMGVWGAQILTKLTDRVGPLKKDLTCVGGSELGSYEDLMNVLRILAPGGSICHVLRGSEALWGFSY